MAELDVFERRFEAAYEQYLAAVPTAVDAAAVARSVATARPRRHIGWLPSIGRPAPALAWLLLLGLLLAALGAAYLLAGSTRLAIVTPNPSSAPGLVLFTCAPGADPDVPGPVDQVRPAGDWSSVAVDSASGRVVLPSGNAIWTFDLCTNSWRESAARIDHGGAVVFDADSRVTVIIGGEGPVSGDARVTAYDGRADVTLAKADAPVVGSWQAVYDVATGLILARDRWTSQLWAYDVDADAWSEIDQTGDIPPIGARLGGPSSDFLAELLAYDASVDRLVLYIHGSESRTYEFDPRTRSWTRQQITTPDLFFAMGDVARSEIAYDEARARTVLGGAGSVIAYDASAHRWEGAGLVPFAGVGYAMTYDPVHRRVVVFGGTDGGAETDAVFAYDLGTRASTSLLKGSNP